MGARAAKSASFDPAQDRLSKNNCGAHGEPFDTAQERLSKNNCGAHGERVSKQYI